MRHPISSPPLLRPSLRRIAAVMSARPLVSAFRGGRGRRGYSDRTPFVVSGDSHFQSVRDTNAGFQLNDSSNNNTNNSQNFKFRYNNNHHHDGYRNNPGGFQFQPQAYRPRPPFNRHPNQPVSRDQRPKPADYRMWEFAKHPPPPHSERFVVLSYNILADYLASSHRNLYFHIPRRFMNWDWRKGNILFELGLWSPDIMCFQEVDKFHDLEEGLRHRGYSSIWKMRTGEPIDGCAIFWRTSRFKLVYEESIEFNKLGMRDNVAQICVLESLIQNNNDMKLALSASSEGPNRVVICNIHVLYNPKRGEIKLGQVRILLERAQAVSKKWDNAPVVLCGDFNCTPKSPLYNFISEQKLDISEFERDKISGQASAEIRPPPRQYGQHSRGQSNDIIANSTVVENSSLSDSHENQNASESSSASLSTANSLQQPPSGESFLDVSNKVSSDSFKSTILSEKVTAKTSNNMEDLSKKNGDSAINVSTDNFKDNQSSSRTDKSAKDVKSTKTTDEMVSEIEQDPLITYSVASKEKDAILITQHNGDNCSKDGLRHATDDLNEDVVDKDSNNFQSDNSCSPSSRESVEVHILGTEANSNPSDPNTSLPFKYDVDEKLVGLSLNEIEKALEHNEDSGEDAEKFLPENENGDAFPSDLDVIILEDLSSSLESEAVDVDKTSYDPSLWTPMEIAVATGDSNNTILEHSLKLRSTYSEVEDCSGTRDSSGEPLVTSYNSCFMGTVDYIWRSEGLCTLKVLAPIPKNAMQPTGGFPTKKWGSDHIALASELAFTKKSDK